MIMELTYTKVGDYYIPDLALDDDIEYEIGIYGRMREANGDLPIRRCLIIIPLLFNSMIIDAILESPERAFAPNGVS